ncbi:NERD domain-containing protein [Niallia circulans]|uniref:nuclease-related domain-containing protein n=1 Tax=Niallia circulans TaxID=1397 RepID=UPI00203EA507|nr:nuclease-related domain-containing protein [Niallia circulans]MCM2982320.1 NERD domain-containing protein [Niallia circulans]
MFLDFLFKNKKKNTIKKTEETPSNIKNRNNSTTKIENNQSAVRKGELGEYKIDIQLSQLPKNYMYLNDLLIKNPKSSTGYSQIDHVIITPYGLFVIETKNYQGTIYGGKDRKTWLINGKFKMMNPLMQNYGHIQALKSFIEAKYHPYFISVVSFTKRCTFKIEEELRKISSTELVIYDVELTQFINRKVAVLKLQYPNPLFLKSEMEMIYNSLVNANITDAAIRKQHIDIIEEKKNITDKKEKENKCIVCQKAVSDKVKSFCLSNKKFQGKIYCYEHQKSL